MQSADSDENYLQFRHQDARPPINREDGDTTDVKIAIEILPNIPDNKQSLKQQRKTFLDFLNKFLGPPKEDDDDNDEDEKEEE